MLPVICYICWCGRNWKQIQNLWIFRPSYELIGGRPSSVKHHQHLFLSMILTWLLYESMRLIQVVTNSENLISLTIYDLSMPPPPQCFRGNVTDVAKWCWQNFLILYLYDCGLIRVKKLCSHDQCRLSLSRLSLSSSSHVFVITNIIMLTLALTPLILHLILLQTLLKLLLQN